MILLVGRWDNFYTPLANNNGVKEKNSVRAHRKPM